MPLFLPPVAAASFVAGMGEYFPFARSPITHSAAISAITALDLTAKKAAMIGECRIIGRGSKTISAAGGGSIGFRLGTTVFADGASTLDIGIQDVSTGSGPVVNPDGTFDVKRTLTGSGLTTAAWNTIAMTGGSGSKTIAHGDLIAVVWDLTARAGSDSVVLQGPDLTMLGTSSSSHRPTSAYHNATAWAIANVLPNVIITFDDGTLGTINDALPFSSMTTDGGTSASNPDEWALLFQSPWDLKIDAYGMVCGAETAAGDLTLSLYSDPLGTPTVLDSLTVLAEQLAANFVYKWVGTLLTAEIQLTKNTDYAIGVAANGAANSRAPKWLLDNTAHRAFYPGSTTLRKGTRQNGTGAFAEESPALTLYHAGVRISGLKT